MIFFLSLVGVKKWETKRMLVMQHVLIFPQYLKKKLLYLELCGKEFIDVLQCRKLMWEKEENAD